MEITREFIQEKAKGALALLDDGFQFSDLMQMAPMVMEIARDVEGATGVERMQVAVALGEYIIDETDTPWLPDPVTDPIMKDLLPKVIQFAFDCAEGQYRFRPAGRAKETTPEAPPEA